MKNVLMLRHLIICVVISGLFCNVSLAQVVINEGSNKNFSSAADENGEYPDWIEIYNSGTDSLNLLNYSLTDDSADITKWTFPDIKLLPGEFRTIFCSGKDRKPVTGFINVINAGAYTPVTGWNTHVLTNPFYWDGSSNILINTCSYVSTGYTVNSIFNQSATSFPSTAFTFADGSPSSCSFAYGTTVYQRPNMQFNGITVGTGVIQNSLYDYPAPYGNWYWGAKNQMLVLASELSSAGLTAGDISSIAFDVVWTEATIYDYIDISMKLISENSVSTEFITVDPNNNLHTNFKISGSGETIYLYSPSQVLLSKLFVNCFNLDNSNGSFPDASTTIYYFSPATPSATNNLSDTYTEYALAPAFSVQSGFYGASVNVEIYNPNGGLSKVFYSLDGSDPTLNSVLYNGNPVSISYSVVLKARVFIPGILPSTITVSSYFIGIDHLTPVLSVVTDNIHLYGGSGIFDNWGYDWKKPAYVEYFDSAYQLIFSQNAGIQIDGGAGGSRSNPQHSFRVDFDDGALGAGSVHYKIIPDRPFRTKYNNIYLRNGSNQYLVFPYKDACQVKVMGSETYNYYSAWRPISVYINGGYFGLYELREKFDTEYFETLEGANPDSSDILTLSYWYGSVLRAVHGEADSFWNSWGSFQALDPADTAFWNLADQYFDMKYYNDYIIGQSWMGNNDWPGNNIKLYRSDITGYRWRFCLIDLELAMAPNSWTDCYFDHISFMLGQNAANPYIGIWLKGIQNDLFRNYFINRYADIMNTSYIFDRISAIENDIFNQTVVEMQNEYLRWGDQNNVPGQMNEFYNKHLIFNSQLAERTNQVRNHIQSNFTLPRQVDVTLDISPPGSGKIHISSIMPETYPWEGVYFDGLPVKIEATANNGFYFLHWGNNSLITDTLNPVFNDTLKADQVNFTAYFKDDNNSAPVLPGYSSDFSLFPNPAINNLFIKNEGINNFSYLKYQIIDMNNRIMQEGNITCAKRYAVINLTNLPASVYLLRIANENETLKLFRFVKIQE